MIRSERFPAISPFLTSESPPRTPSWWGMGMEEAGLRGSTESCVLPDPSWVRCARYVAERNDSATYLAQRTQLGSGNTQDSVDPRNPASSIPIPHQDGVRGGDSLVKKGDMAGNRSDRIITTTGWSTEVHYLAEAGNSGSSPDQPMLLEQQSSSQPGPEDENGPATLRGPKRDELWITPDTRAATLA